MEIDISPFKHKIKKDATFLVNRARKVSGANRKGDRSDYNELKLKTMMVEGGYLLWGLLGIEPDYMNHPTGDQGFDGTWRGKKIEAKTTIYNTGNLLVDKYNPWPPKWDIAILFVRIRPMVYRVAGYTTNKFFQKNWEVFFADKTAKALSQQKLKTIDKLFETKEEDL